MATYKTEGIVLKQFDIGEADKIITFYTGNKGKVRAVARRARKTNSRLSGLVQPFSYCRLVIYRGKSLDKINHIKSIYPFSILREDLDKMAYASYMAEFVEKVGMEDAPNESLFSLLLLSFHKLITADKGDLNYINLTFKVKMLVVLGFKPELNYCLDCGDEVKTSNRNYLSIAEGGLYCSCCSIKNKDLYSISGESLQVFKKLLNAGPKFQSNLKISDTACKELDELISKFIAYHLNLKLKSEKFLHIITDLG